MLINLRNALMAGKRLPYDAEVEYIESTGTQYINSGLTVSNALRVKCRVSIEGVCWIFGGRTGGNNKQFSVYQQGSTKIRFGYANAASDKTDSYGVHDIDFNQNAVYFDGALLHTFAASTFSSASPLYIGTLSIGESGTPASQCLIGNIYAFQIYVDGVLVRDYIPVRVGTVGYLYDRVSGKLFGNAGTGDFVIGPDVVPVEWLGTTGSQCVDTGIRATPDSVIRCTLTPISRTTKGMVFWGAGKADGTAGYGDMVELVDQYSLGGHIVFIATGRAADGLGVSYGNTLVTTANCSTGALTVNDTTAITANRLLTGTAQYPLYIGCANIAGTIFRGANCRYHSFAIEQSGIIVGSFYPVRVGTDATSWEGAMIDTLTRRIYRNAGTGAFTYGNDLKYPIPAE